MKRIAIIIAALMIAPTAWSSCILQEDAATTVPIKLVDGNDGITAETGLTVAQADIRLWKEGGTTFAQKNDATACTHRESGWYTCPLDATDTNTAGQLIIATDETVSAESVVPFELRCTVIASAYYDIFDGSTQIMTSRQGGNSLKTTVASVTSQTELVLTAGASNNDAYNNSFIEIVGGTEECSRMVSDYVGSTTTVTLDSACPFTVAPADEAYIHSSPASTQVDSINTGIAGLNDISLAGVNNEIDTALAELGLDKLFAVNTTIDTLSTQDSFTLVGGSTDDDAYNGCGIIIIDQSTPTQKAYAGIQDYDGATLGVTLDTDPGIFTMATADSVLVLCLPATVEFMNKSEVLGSGSPVDKWRGNP